MRSRLLFLMAAISIVAWGAPATAAEFPSKPITLIIPYPAGGSTDIITRALANRAKVYLGQPVICENKAGGGATVGPALLTTKMPDGYSLGIITSSVPIAWHMGKTNFNPLEDLTHVMCWGRYLNGIVVNADSPWKTLQELIQYAKENPQKVTYGSPGFGTNTHLAMEDLAMLAGIQLVHIPYKGSAETIPALLGRHVDLVTDSSSWAPMVDAGKFRLLATYGGKRSTRYPQVPTVKEIGYGMTGEGVVGLVGPKGIPNAILARLHDAFQKSLDDPDFLLSLKKFDMSVYYLNSKDYGDFIRQEDDIFGRLVKKLGLDKN